MEAPRNSWSTVSPLHRKLICALQELEASKHSYQVLKRDLMKGMDEAKDIFNAMSVPLVRLVGLKMHEMSAEGRKSSVLTSMFSQLSPKSPDQIPFLCTDNTFRATPKPDTSPAYSLKEENMKIRATNLVSEYSQIQKQQMKQMFALIKTVESLVRNEEEVITAKFQHAESYLNSLLQNSLVHLKCLHKQVTDLRQQDNHQTFRLQLAEQSYQSLMSLVIKIQENGICKMKKNLSDLKTYFEGTVNDLANSMCKPLVSILKEQKKYDGEATVVSKLQKMVENMESKFSAEGDKLTAANEKMNIQFMSLHFQLESQKKCIEEMCKERDALKKTINMQQESIDFMRKSLASEIAEHQELKALLENEKARGSRYEEEIEHMSAKLLDAFRALQETNQLLHDEQLQLTEASLKANALLSQLTDMKQRLNQGITSFEGSQIVEESNMVDINRKLQDNVCSQSSSNQTSMTSIGLPWHHLSQMLWKCMGQSPTNDNLVKEDHERDLKHQNFGLSMKEHVMKSWVAMLKNIQTLIGYIEDNKCHLNSNPELKCTSEFSTPVLGICFLFPLLLSTFSTSDRTDPPAGNSGTVQCKELEAHQVHENRVAGNDDVAIDRKRKLLMLYNQDGPHGYENFGCGDVRHSSIPQNGTSSLTHISSKRLQISKTSYSSQNQALEIHNSVIKPNQNEGEITVQPPQQDNLSKNEIHGEKGNFDHCTALATKFHTKTSSNSETKSPIKELWRLLETGNKQMEGISSIECDESFISNLENK